MVEQVFEALRGSIIMVTSFCVFMMFCIASNTLLGVVSASKTQTFSASKLFKGIVRNAVFVLGVDALAVGVDGVAKLIDIYGIIPDYAESITNISSLAIVGIIITLSYKVYGAQAIEKIRGLGSLSENDVIPISRQDGWERRGT